MGDVLYFQGSIGGRRIDAGVEGQVGTIWEGVRLAKHIAKQASKVALQAKGEMGKVNSGALKETASIKA